MRSPENSVVLSLFCHLFFVIPPGLPSWQRGTVIPEVMGKGGDFTYRLCPQDSVTSLTPVRLS